MNTYRVQLTDVDVAYFETEAEDEIEAIENAEVARKHLRFMTKQQQYSVEKIS